MDQIKIGKYLQELRKEKGLTQEQLAEHVGVARRTISRWETGSNMPDLDILIELDLAHDGEFRTLLDGRGQHAVFVCDTEVNKFCFLIAILDQIRIDIEVISPALYIIDTGDTAAVQSIVCLLSAIRLDEVCDGIAGSLTRQGRIVPILQSGISQLIHQNLLVEIDHVTGRTFCELIALIEKHNAVAVLLHG